MPELITCPSCGTQVRNDLGYVRCPQCSKPLAGDSQTPIQDKPIPTREERRMKEYKVMTQKDRWFGGKFDPEKLEGAINSYAAQGWSVVSMATASIPSFGGNREEMVILFEREK